VFCGQCRIRFQERRPTEPMSKLLPSTAAGRAGMALAALAGLALGAHWFRELAAVDSCLDSGHVYDYLHERCDTTALTLPIIPYGERHGTLVRVASGLILAGVALAVASPVFRSGVWPLSFSGAMALLIMGLAVWAVPGWGKLVLLTPIIIGAGWALIRLRRSG